MSKVAVISVCLNDEKNLSLFLENMKEWSYDNYQFMLVDNGSKDRSVEMVRDRCPGTVVVQLGQNLGTTGGYNRGIRKAQEMGVDYVMLLALDVLLAPDCIRVLVDELDAQPQIGAIGPILFKSHDRELVECMGFTVDRRDWSFSANYGGQREPLAFPLILDADYIDGGTSLFRLSALEVGLLDEQLFMYGEDADMCLRLRHQGYRVVATSNTRACHRHTEIRRASPHPRPYQVYYMYRNLIYLVRKHGSPSERRAYYLRLISQMPRSLAYYAVRERSPRLAAVYIEAILHGLMGKMGKTKYVQ